MIRNIVFFSLLVFFSTAAWAQGFIETDYLTSSGMSDKAGTEHGSGDMLRINGRYTVPLSVKTDDRKRPTAWTATLAASYTMFGNEGEAAEINPDRVLNASLNVSHSRPLSERWRLMASLGAGVYSDPSEIAFRSILANGAVIFAYQINEAMSVGVGGGLTNSYGVPMLLPMGYFTWRTGGRFKLDIDMASGLKIKASTTLGKRFGAQLTAIEIDGFSAVRRIDGEAKIYSSTMMRSTLGASYRLAPKLSLLAGVGGTWLRAVSLSDRSLKGFFSQFGDDEGKYRFKPSLRLSIGISYGL